MEQPHISIVRKGKERILKKKAKMLLANVSGGLICLLISPDHPTTVGTVWKVALNLDIDRFTCECTSSVLYFSVWHSWPD